MTEHRWYEFVILRTEFDLKELLEVVDNIAFDNGRRPETLFEGNTCGGCSGKDLRLSHQEIATELNTSRNNFTIT
jgi:CRP/FNR family transcriptional regulator